MKPLIYLTYRLLVNGLKNILTTPKKLIPVILIGFWLITSLGSNIFLYSMHSHMGRAVPALVMPELTFSVIWAGIFSILSVIVVWVIYSALSEGSLVFTLQQIDFLFPTPIDRRSVLLLKLISDYLRYAATAAFVIFLGGSVIMPFVGNVSALPLAWIAVVSLLILAMNVSHTLKIVTTYGMRKLQLAALVVKLVILAAVVMILVTVGISYGSNHDAVASLASALKNGPVRVLFLPIAWCTDVVVGPLNGGVGRGMELLWLLGLTTASFVVLIMRPENFYEPSLSVSARMAKVKAAARSGGWSAIRAESRRRKGRTTYGASFIPPFGKGAIATLWKSLIIMLRTSGQAIVFASVLIPIAAALVGRYVVDNELRNFIGVVIPYFALLFALSAMNRMRNELQHTNIIKTMPIPGIRIVAAMVSEHWIIMLYFMGLIWISLLTFTPGVDPHYLNLAFIAAVTCGLSLISIVAILTMMYPDMRDKLQQMIPNLLAFIFVGVGMLPTVIIVVIAAWLKLNLLLTTLMLLIVNSGVTWGALSIAGMLYDRYDPTSD